MKRIATILFGILLAAGWPSLGVADETRVDPRESAVDRALGGMVEGSRMPSPEGSFTERGRRLPGNVLSPTIDTQAGAAGGTSPQAPVAQGSIGPGTLSGSFESAPPGSSGSDIGGAGNPGGEHLGPESGELSGGAGGDNLESGISVGLELGGGTEISAEPSGGSIIDIDADVNVSGGEAGANLDIGFNTEAENLLELDATSDVAMDAPVSAETDSTESAVIETDLGVEEGINEAPASGEVEAGIEADVDASGESDEPINSPADGLSL